MAAATTTARSALDARATHEVVEVGSLVMLQQGGLIAGRYPHAGTQLDVTRGCGYRGPRFRLLAPLEITRVIPRAA